MTDYAALRAEKDEFFASDVMSPFDEGTFEGLKWFPPDEDLVFEVALRPVEEEEVAMATSTGEEQVYRSAYEATVAIGGTEATLTLYRVPGYEHLFLPFRDRTCGVESYGAGRYLDVPLDGDGTATIDFNLAYNPTCAYDDGWTCPLPPPGNWLTVRIEAGEQSYK